MMKSGCTKRLQEIANPILDWPVITLYQILMQISKEKNGNTTSLRIKRRLKAAAKQYVAGNLTYERYNSTLQSYMGMMKHNDCYRFKMQLLEDVETIINESGVAA